MYRRKSHVAAGLPERLGLSDRPLTICPKLKTIKFTILEFTVKFLFYKVHKEI
jgi:hypothetical protein